jgi:uroporphyrinogen decarboxylase
MNSRERVYRALHFQTPDRAPRDLWAVPAIAMTRPADLAAVLDRFPADIVLPVNTDGTAVSAFPAGAHDTPGDLVFAYGEAERASGTAFVRGSYVDEWGCAWEVGEDGICGGTDRFVLTPWHIDPFERMQFLRGTEALLMDLAYGSVEVLRLRDMVHEFNLREVELWCRTAVDAVRVADDWGAQTSLLVSPAMWREYFKPLYADYFRLIRGAGKFVFFHSDGNITPIIPELIEMGADALNAQLFCMDIEALAEQYRGRVTFWGEIDRQWILPYGGTDDVRAAVHRVRQVLDDGRGGVIAQLEWGKDVPRANVEAAYEAWLE